jgi:hypothetical protein
VAVAVEQLFRQTFQRATYCKDEGGRMKIKSRGVRAELKTFQQAANRIVIAGGEKRQAALAGAKNQTDIDACPAFEIVFPKTANAQA